MSFNKFPNPSAEEKIRNYASKSGFENISMVLRPGSAKGNNFVGVVFKIKIRGSKDGKEESFDAIVKCAPIDAEARENLPIQQFFLREIYIYTELIPLYEQLQNATGIRNGYQMLFPKCFTVNTEELNEFLVMQDLSLEGYKLHEPKSKPLDMMHMTVALKMLAKFHGLSFALERINPDLFKEMVKNLPEPLWIDCKASEPIETYIKTATKQALKVLKDNPDYKYLEQYSENSFKSLCKASVPGKYSVICHGDYWKNNMLFNYDKSNEPISVIPIDYQTVRYASPATDLLYIFFLCTDKELRDREYDNMLEIYFEALTESLEQFSLNVEEVLPKEEFLREVQRIGSFAMGIAIMGLIFMTTSGEELADPKEAFKDNIEWDENGQSFSLYKERIAGALEDCVKYGYLKL